MSLLERLPKVRGDYRENVDLSKLCWFRVGGLAKVLFKPKDTDDLSNFLINKPQHIPHFIFGVGSNLLIRDNGFDGVVVRLGRSFNYINLENNELIVGAATLDLNLAHFCEEHSIQGLEFLAGVPGTIGGALAMNAGAYGTEIKDVLICAKAINDKGEIVELTNDDFKFCYRGHSLNENYIFIEATFKAPQGIQVQIAEKIKKIQSERAQTQPIKSRTSGSTFKNPLPLKAWELIDQAGCRGLTIGGAQVSEQHCNFFINTGNATAKDIEDLILEVQKRVKKTTGIELQTEIKIVGY